MNTDRRTLPAGRMSVITTGNYRHAHGIYTSVDEDVFLALSV